MLYSYRNHDLLKGISKVFEIIYSHISQAPTSIAFFSHHRIHKLPITIYIYPMNCLVQILQSAEQTQ